MNLTHFIGSEHVVVDMPFYSIDPSDTGEVVVSYLAGGTAEAGRAAWR